MVPIWVLYVSIWAQSIHNYATSPIQIPHGAHMVLLCGFQVGKPIWAPYGFYMFLSGLSRSIIMPLRPYRYHMGPIWFYYVGSRWENPYGPHMGFICFYLGSVDPEIRPHRPYRYHMGPIWFLLSGFYRWDKPYGPHMGFTWYIWAPVGPHNSHMGPRYFAIWDWPNAEKPTNSQHL